MTAKAMTPDEFDQALARVHVREDRIIWTAKGIAGHLGCGEDYVRRTLAREAGSPIRQRGRRIYVYADELDRFMRSDPNKPAR